MLTRSIAAVSLLLIPAVLPAQQSIERCTAVNTPTPDAVRRVEFVVSMLGNVLRRPAVAVTEEDQVRVRVLTNEALANRLAIRRSSPARRTGELRIIGMSQGAVDPDLFAAVKAAAVDPRCYVDVTLDDFEPGLGEAEIHLVTQTGTEITRIEIGGFDFNVEPLYAGMVSLGPIITRLADPAFEVATNASGERYIAQVESGRDRILYGLVYTPFVLGKRVSEPALTRNLRSWLQRVNPMFGIVVNDVRRNALAGLSVDLPFGLVAHAGWHMGRTSEIDPASGLEVGSLFPFEEEGSIPVVRTWDSNGFAGLTLDMRVALRMLGLAGSAAVQ